MLSPRELLASRNFASKDESETDVNDEFERIDVQARVNSDSGVRYWLRWVSFRILL
jgi:hypothetical protein